LCVYLTTLKEIAVKLLWAIVKVSASIDSTGWNHDTIPSFGALNFQPVAYLSLCKGCVKSANEKNFYYTCLQICLIFCVKILS